MATASPDAYLEFLTAGWAETRFLELRDGNDLLAVAVTDRQPDSLSAVYTFGENVDGARVKVRALEVIEKVGVGQMVSDLVAFVGSLDIVLGEIDR
mgnify:CR=1 FL=1